MKFEPQRSLGVVDRNELTELIASEIIEISATGVRDPVEICKIAIKRPRYEELAKTNRQRLATVQREAVMEEDAKKRMPFVRTWRVSGN